MTKVLIAGHFNPLHIGHLQLIQAARKLGDYLIVVVANDIQAKLKRPKVFLSAAERMAITYSIKGVDEVQLSVDEDADICLTLFKLKPDVFASGCDEFHPDVVKEKKVCDGLGIEVVYNVGGEKIRSSSDILKKYYV